MSWCASGRKCEWDKEKDHRESLLLTCHFLLWKVMRWISESVRRTLVELSIFAFGLRVVAQHRGGRTYLRDYPCLSFVSQHYPRPLGSVGVLLLWKMAQTNPLDVISKLRRAGLLVWERRMRGNQAHDIFPFINIPINVTDAKRVGLIYCNSLKR